MEIACYFITLIAFSSLSFAVQYVQLEEQKNKETELEKVCVNLSKIVARTDERFLSVALDSNLLRTHWERFQFHTTRVINMAKALKPAVLRIGGTSADFTIFDGTSLGVMTPKFTNFTIYPQDIDNINTFSQLSGWDVFFDLNVLLRNKDGSWNSSNAVSLMKYVSKNGYKFAWELGNEPTLFHDFNKSLDAVQLGLDYKALRSILLTNPEFGQFLAGPAITGFQNDERHEYFKSFLSVCGSVLSAVTWHHYYLNGRIATLDQFYDSEVLDSVVPQMELITDLTSKSAPQAQVWLGETSSAYGGGAPGVSDTYAAGFMWLDKLGLAARSGHKIVVRQTWFNGNYALIDENLEPNPDYWTSVLYKMLVGPGVLEVKNGLETLRKTRVYAHCTNTRNGLYADGSVTLIVINIHQSSSVQILLTDTLGGLDVDEYLLTPAGNLTSKSVELNGSVLKLVNNTSLPEIKPKQLPPSQPIILPPLSYGFYVVAQAKAVACLAKNV